MRVPVHALLLGLLLPRGGLAYSWTLDERGRDLRWPVDGPDGRAWLPLACNPTNASGIPHDVVTATVVRALQRWKLVADGRLDFDVWAGTDPDSFVPAQRYDGLNSVFFASAADGPRPSPSIAGHTQVWFDPATGRILEADIVLNDLDWTFTTDPAEASYTGGGKLLLDDVLTHELGHAWGLGHSGLMAATMFTAAWNGQATPACDDVAALRSLYGLAAGTGTLTGRLERGGVPVGGAQVTAVSRTRGLPVASALSGPDGRFRIDGLEPGEHHLVVEPFAAGVDGLSAWYGAPEAACGAARLARSFVADGGVLRTWTVSPHEATEVGVLEAVCTPDGSAHVDTGPDRLVVGAGVVLRVRDGDRHVLRLVDAEGPLTLSLLGTALFSPVRGTLEVRDAAGRPVVPRATLVPQGGADTVSALWDARVEVELPVRGDYDIVLDTRAVPRSAWPLGARHVDGTGFAVLLAEPSSGEPGGGVAVDPTTCLPLDPLPDYVVRTGTPFRRGTGTAPQPIVAGCAAGCSQTDASAAGLLLIVGVLAGTRRRPARRRRPG